MQINARICKILPERTGTSENGSWSFTPMIIEFDEQAINGVKTHSARIELSGKTFKIDALKAQQNLLDDEMDKLGEKHIAATAGTDHPYVPKTKPTIVVL